MQQGPDIVPDLGHLVKNFIFKSFSSFPKVLGQPAIKKDHPDCTRETESEEVRTEMDLKVATALDSEAEALVPCPRGQAVGQHETGGNLEGRSGRARSLET